MAAYAALVSLINTMEQIQNNPRLSVEFDTKQIECFREKICFLLDFVEANSRGAEGDLETMIASAAYEAEDVIESHVVDRIHATSAAAPTISLLDLHNVIEEMECIKEKVIKWKQGNASKPARDKKSDDGLIQLEQLEKEEVEEKVGSNDVQPSITHSLEDATSSMPPMSTNNSAMIGFDDELIKLMEMLVGQAPSRRIIPVDGMGGIGKTTLARNTYQNLTIVNHFDIQAWVTVSQTYTMKAIMLELLKSCQKRSHDDINVEDYELGEEMHRILWGRRYLIILDDVWSVEAWEKIMFFFPDNNNRSRIVVTTRLSNMATYFGSPSFSMDLLDEEKSWNLFCEKAFAQQGRMSTPELEKIGKEISKKCKGLPLSITVIGGLLGKSSMTHGYWESVKEDINWIMNSGDDEHCLNILSLSYTHLPAHLKPCFLYMGVFPEDHEVRVSRLIKLWVAEGFLKPNEIQSLEEIAESYVMDLVGRNLVKASQWGVSGKLKFCNIHDILRDMCLRIAEKEKFLRVVNTRTNIPGDMSTDRRLVLDGYDHPEDLESLKPASLARSLICRTGWQAPFKFRMLRVLDEVHDDSSEILSQQVNVRYLAFKYTHPKELSSYISMFWNLQTFISAEYTFFAPIEIWEMPQLRHLEFGQIYFPDPPIDREHGVVLQNLQTLTGVMDMSLSEELCRRIPNVRKLGLWYIRESEFQRVCSCLPNLGRLRCKFGWEDLALIGTLPNLQVLKLLYQSVNGFEWNPIEGQFLGLKYLKIDFCGSLTRWNADCFHFPVLEKLCIMHLPQLEEIPLGIGEIPTLRLIDLVMGSESCAISALKILEEQEGQGNESLHVRIEFFEEEEAESFMERVDPQTRNIQVEFNL